MRWLAERCFVVMLVLVAALAGTGCDETTDSDEPVDLADVTSLDERPCPDGSTLTYESFGGPFILSWCSGCHASALAAEERQGAPIGSDFDTIERIRAASDRIWARSADHNDTMPPQTGPDEDERARLGEWLACGSP